MYHAGSDCPSSLVPDHTVINLNWQPVPTRLATTPTSADEVILG